MFDVQMTDLTALQEFMDSDEIRPLISREPPTLMEIAGIEYRENVYSNILKFLIDPSEAHGLGPLFIRSILEAYRSALETDRQEEAPDPQTVRSLHGVECEVTTTAGNRIDILVEGADFIVCIENKIWSRLDNPLDDYRKYCEDIVGKRFVGIVLSPRRISPEEISEFETTEGPGTKNTSFVSVTYRDIVTMVRKYMGDYIGSHNTKYLHLLFDFIEQSSRLDRSTMMTEEQERFLAFWKKNEDKIENIESNCKAIRTFAKEMAVNHYDECKEQLTEKRVFTHGFEKNDFTVWFELFDEGSIDGCRIFLDVWFHPLHGIEHQVGDRGYPRSSQGLPELVKKIGKESRIEFEDTASSGPNSKGRFLLKKKELSPFCEADRKKAVTISVAILKAIAKLLRERDASSEQQG